MSGSKSLPINSPSVRKLESGRCPVFKYRYAAWSYFSCHSYLYLRIHSRLPSWSSCPILQTLWVVRRCGVPCRCAGYSVSHWAGSSGPSTSNVPSKGSRFSACSCAARRILTKIAHTLTNYCWAKGGTDFKGVLMNLVASHRIASNRHY